MQSLSDLTSYIRKHRHKLLYVLLAEISLIVITLILLTSSRVNVSYSFLRALFALICAFGIIAGVSPSAFSFNKDERVDGQGVSGHHPDCGLFAGHTVNLFGSQRCAGCTGLVVGALVSLAGILLLSPSNLIGKTTLWVGVLFVGLGLAQHFIDLGNGWVHLGLNILLVTGSWFMFDFVSSTGLGLLVQVYFLLVTVFWIWVRIRVSQFTHVGVCADCTERCVHVFT
jgi:hypothetical protein